MGCCASVSAVQVPNPSRCQLGESRYEELIAVMFLSYEPYEVSVSSSLECSSLLSSLFSQACSKFDHFICRKNMQPVSYSESYDFQRYTQKGFVQKAGRVKIRPSYFAHPPEWVEWKPHASRNQIHARQ